MTSLLNKLKLIWQGRAIAESLVDIKSHWKEPSFWLALLTNVTTAVAALGGYLNANNAPWFLVVNAVVTAGYNYVRGLQKAQSDGVKPFSTSTEFYLGLVGMVNNALVGMKTGGLDSAWIGGATVLLGHAIAAARDLANMRPKEVVAAGAATVSPAQ